MTTDADLQPAVAAEFVALADRSLQATDLDWSYGSGPLLRGQAEDLTLVLCGRALPAGRVDGEPL